MGVVIPLQRARHQSRPSRQLRLAYPDREPGAAMRACLEEVRRDTTSGRPLSRRFSLRRSPDDPPDAA